MKTLEMLERKFNGPTAPLTEVASEYLGIQSRKAADMAGKNQLPIPAHRLGSQKSPWLVLLSDLAKLIDDKAAMAREGWGSNAAK